MLVLGLVAAAGAGTALDVSVPAIMVSPSEHYDSAWERGIRGSGTTIAVLDTGVDDGQDAFADAFVAGADLSGGDVDDDATPGCESGDPLNPDDTHGHGTHVAGIALSRGDGDVPAGVAPGASLVDVKIANNLTGLSNPGVMEEAIEWTIRYNAGDTCYGDPGQDRIDVVSISFGTLEPGETNTSKTRMVANATDAGITVVVSAGNCGPGTVEEVPDCGQGSGDRNTVTSPGTAAAAITVGAADDNDTVHRNNDRIAPYSSRGPGGKDQPAERKPNVVAPGSTISSACHEESTEPVWSPDGTCWKSGTSMAAPHVAGVVALLEEAAGGIAPDEAKAVLEETAHDRGSAGWDRAWGWGYVDARAAVDEVLPASDDGSDDQDTGDDDTEDGSDGDGDSSDAQNRSPTARADVSPDEGTTDTIFTLDGSASSDPDGDGLDHTWSLPDGDRTGAVANVSFDEAGNHTVNLTVTDPSGAADRDQVTVHVRPPEADGEAEDTADGGNATEDGSASGDGTTGEEDTASGADGSSEGTDDGDGSTDDEAGNASQADEEGPRSPLARVESTPSRPEAGEPVRLDPTGSRDPDGEVVSVEWYLDGGREPDESTTLRPLNHTFENPGQREVTIVVRDDDGLKSDPATVTVHVERPVDETRESSASGTGSPTQTAGVDPGGGADGSSDASGADGSEAETGTSREAPGTGPAAAALAGLAAALSRRRGF